MFGQKIMEYLKTLGEISETSDGLTRLCFTDEHKKSIELIKSWMTEAKLKVEVDPIGNVIGTYNSNNKNAKTLVIGSHQDSVPCGGIFDGMVGIIVPLIGLKYALTSNNNFPYNIKLIAFSEEEGTRFGFPYLGSKYYAGILKNDELYYKDDNGITVVDAIENFGLDSSKLYNLSLRKDVDVYLEFHIEQGPVLESNDLPLGIVTSIVAMKGYDVTIFGKSGHAGTLPMNMRQDAGCGAFEIALEIEKLGKEINDLVATTGKMQVKPNGSNVVINEAKFSLDIRSTNDDLLSNVEDSIFIKINEICKRRNLTYKIDKLFESNATPCSNDIVDTIEKSFLNLNLEPFKLYSGAGHDAQEMAKITNMGMVFVRCRDGVSHNPLENVNESDLNIACKVFLEILNNIKL